MFPSFYSVCSFLTTVARVSLPENTTLYVSVCHSHLQRPAATSQCLCSDGAGPCLLYSSTYLPLWPSPRELVLPCPNEFTHKVPGRLCEFLLAHLLCVCITVVSPTMAVEPCYSECVLWTSGIDMAWQLFGKVESQAEFQTY